MMTGYIDHVLERGENKKWEGRISRKVMTFSLVISLIVIFHPFNSIIKPRVCKKYFCK